MKAGSQADGRAVMMVVETVEKTVVALIETMVVMKVDSQAAQTAAMMVVEMAAWMVEMMVASLVAMKADSLAEQTKFHPMNYSMIHR